jgi:hypothetical protein
LVQGTERSLDLSSDGQGRWGREDGTHIGEVAGALDVDLAVSPITTTIPMHRLALSPGASADTKAVLVSVPSLHVTLSRHRYTCIANDGQRARYRDENLVTGKIAELTLDAHMFVVDYPDAFRRIF